MNVLAPLAAPVPLTALVALRLFASDGDGNSGSRTVVGACVVLLVMAVVIAIGLMMSRGKSA